MIERSTAKKVQISSLMNGKWEKQEGMNPSFVVTDYGEKVARARIMATVVGKFVAEDQGFASITLDDATDTMRAKTFKTVDPIGSVEVGDLVDVIGKVREWNGEIYVIPEIVHKVTDPNLELLRKLELRKNLQGFGGATPAEQSEQKEDLRGKVLEVIEKDAEGITFDALLKSLGKPEELVEKVVNDLLGEGVCYEPSPGKIKKI